MISEPIRVKYLEAMGIVVWYSRPRFPQADLSSAIDSDLDVEETGTGDKSASASVMTISKGTLPEQVDALDTAGQSSSGAVSEFTLHMAQYPGCLLVFDLDEPVAKLPDEYQRLLNDLAFSIGKENAPAQFFQINRPLTSTDDMDQAVQQRVSELIVHSDTCLVVMGEAARRLLFGEQTGARLTTSFQGKRAIAVMGIDQLFKDPISKRSLWSRLHEIVPVM